MVTGDRKAPPVARRGDDSPDDSCYVRGKGASPAWQSSPSLIPWVGGISLIGNSSSWVFLFFLSALLG